MAWYSDEEYVFRQDCREKKNVAASAFKKRTHCGKSGKARFPHEYLTKKELEKMNGECKSYQLNKPMDWETFKSMPDDLKVSYIKSIREKFGATDKAIAGMMGINVVTFGKWIRCCGLGVGSKNSGGPRKWGKDKFQAWCDGVEEKISEEEHTGDVIGEVDISDTTEALLVALEESMTSENPSAEPVEPSENEDVKALDNWVNHLKNRSEGEKKASIVVPETGHLTFDCEADKAFEMLRGMLGDTRVKLSVSWTVVNQDDTCRKEV